MGQLVKRGALLGAFTVSIFLQASMASAAPKALPDVAEAGVRSVVNISSTKRMASRGMMSDPFLRRFFGQQRNIPQPRGNSLGSGVVISRDGLVLTNSHVVHETTDIKVTTADGKEFEADIVGTDPKSDVAVLRIKGSTAGLVPMKFGDSKALRLGETVVAIGNPFGLGHTVTMGIVSAKGRANMGITDYEDFIQTDAAINPGNSGGALVNMQGELVGINTAIVSRSGGYQGIGFAIPTHMAVAIKDSLVATGTVRRGWLGVSIQPLDQRIAQHLGISKDVKGVLVSGVLDGTPADRAGLQSGDVITAVDGVKTNSPATLRNTIAMKGEGSTARIAYLREGRATSVSVVLGELDDSPAVASNRVESMPKQKQYRGLSVRDLDGQARKRLRLDAQINGALVIGVDPGSAANKAGIQEGDIIVAVQKKKVESARKFRRLMKSLSGDVLMRIVRRGQATFVLLGADEDN